MRTDSNPPVLCRWVNERGSGLHAVVVVDRWRGGDTETMGLAAGGIRTHRYPSHEAAEADATRLARAMSLKCALAQLPIGGCKTVVMKSDTWDRPAAFRALGQQLGEWKRRIHTAGDLGTTPTDLAHVAESFPSVHLDEEFLGLALADGVVACTRACRALAQDLELESVSLRGVRVVVQGCGSVGTAVALALARTGAQVALADLVESRAAHLKKRVAALSATRPVVVPDALAAEADVLVACAAGGLIDASVASSLRYRAVVAAANNLLSSAQAAEILQQRAIALVPGIVASSGAVIAGIAGRVLPQLDRDMLLAAIGPRALRLLRAAHDHGCSSEVLAHEEAWQALASA